MEKIKCMYDYEYTDTFGGEPNYCWVKKGTVLATALNSAVRAAKKALHLNGVRCKADYYGNSADLRPVGWNTVLFVSIRE